MLNCQFWVRKVRTSECSVHGVEGTLRQRHLLIHCIHTKSWGSFALYTLHPVQVLYKVGIVSQMVLFWADGSLKFIWWILEIDALSFILDKVRYLYWLLDHLFNELTNTLLVSVTHFIISCFHTPHCTKLALLDTFKIFLSRKPFFVLIDVVHFYFIYL